MTEGRRREARPPTSDQHVRVLRRWSLSAVPGPEQTPVVAMPPWLLRQFTDLLSLAGRC